VLRAVIGVGDWHREGAVITDYNQLMVAPNVKTFNIAGLTLSTGSREGTYCPKWY